MKCVLVAIVTFICISSSLAVTIVPEPQISEKIRANHSELVCADSVGKKFVIAQYSAEVRVDGVKTKIFVRTTSWDDRKIEQREEMWTDTKRSTWSRSVRNSKGKYWLKYDDSEQREAHEQFLAEMHTTDKEYQSLYKSCVEAHAVRIY